MALAILVAMVIIWLSPIQDVTAELRARTQPTLLDLGVAVVGGIAGVYAIMRKLSGVMVGVAIATALVPPLSTIGFGLATGRFDFALGASLLFLTNTLAIAFAATIVARLNRFGPSMTAQHTAMQVVGIIVTLGILSIPLALSLNDIARELRARTTVQAELDRLLGKDDRVDTLNVRLDGDDVAVDGVVLVDQYASRLNAELAAKSRDKLDRSVRVSIVQLRQQTNAAAEFEEQLNRRIATLEQRDADSRNVIAGLTVGALDTDRRAGPPRGHPARPRGRRRTGCRGSRPHHGIGAGRLSAVADHKRHAGAGGRPRRIRMTAQTTCHHGVILLSSTRA